MKNKGLKILLSVLLVLCIIMAGALIGKEYIGDNIKEAANRNGVDVVKDTSDAGKAEDNAVDSTAEGKESTQSDATEADTQQPQMSTIVITATGTVHSATIRSKAMTEALILIMTQRDRTTFSAV